MPSIANRVMLIAAAGACLAACAAVGPAQRIANSPCHDTPLTLYFEAGSETLTDAGRQIVALNARRMKGCKVKELKLVGLADPTGSPQVNLTLSQHRADNVLNAFVKEGLPVPKYTLLAAGQQGAVTANGAVVPVRRQVDVTVVVGR